MSKYKNILVVLVVMVIAPITVNATPLVLTDNAANACRALSPGQIGGFRVSAGGIENRNTEDTSAVCSVTNAYDANGGGDEYTDVNIVMTVNSLPAAMDCKFYMRDPSDNNSIAAVFFFTIPANTSGVHFVGAVTDIESFTTPIWELNSYAQCTVPGDDGISGRARIYNISTFNFSGPGS